MFLEASKSILTCENLDLIPHVCLLFNLFTLLKKQTKKKRYIKILTMISEEFSIVQGKKPAHLILWMLIINDLICLKYSLYLKHKFEKYIYFSSLNTLPECYVSIP